MKTPLQQISLPGIFRFVAWCMAASWISAGVFAFYDRGSLGGALVSVGGMAALIGSSVALWFSIRGRSWRLVILAACALLTLVHWGEVIYRIVYGELR